jgi:hypothetical protein
MGRNGQAEVFYITEVTFTNYPATINAMILRLPSVVVIQVIIKFNVIMEPDSSLPSAQQPTNIPNMSPFNPVQMFTSYY